MKKLHKSLISLTGVGLMGLALASCGSKSTRNSSIPYANIYNSDTVIATATNDLTNEEMSMTLGQFYSRLRYSGYTLITQNIRKMMYENEYNAVKEVIANETLTSNVSDKTKALLVPTKNDTKLYNLEDKTLDYSLTKTNYEYIRSNLVKALSQSLSQAIFSSTSAEAIVKMDDLDNKLDKYIEARQREGINITKADLAYTEPTDDSDTLVFTNLNNLVSNKETLVTTYLLTQAELLASKNALYEIADEEYIFEFDQDPEKDTKTKNKNYIFDEDKLESSYDSSIKTYGTYHAVAIQFNSRKDAEDAMKKVSTQLGYSLTELDKEAADYTDKVKAFYKALYNETYEYNPVADLDDERFIYTINESKNDLDELNNSNITSYITDTLENGEFFLEPRNVANKYIMVYRITSKYDVTNTDEEKAYDDLTAEEKAKYEQMIKYNLLTEKASSYTTTVYNKNIYTLMNDDDKANDLKIYDPFMEYKYNSAYSNVYTLMDKKDFKDDAIFSYNGKDYTVADFYNEAKNQYGSSILSNYFQLEYAYSYNSNEEYLDSDTHDDNVETLNNAIKTFNKNKNTAYPKAMGLSNYLLSAYGYETKADVIKYYYDAAQCLSAYKTKTLYKDWAVLDQEKTDEKGSNVYTLSESATTGFLNNILATGNNKYSKLFSLDIDHLLIYVDFDGDGSPDDPDTFLKKQDDQTVTKFKDAVANLAKAVYTEAISGLYGDSNSLYTVVEYIKTAYEEGQPLKTDPTKTWDDYKEFQFILKAEKLASSGSITQDSVTNFVTPFQDYVKGVYKTLSAMDLTSATTKTYDDGLFYIYNGETETGTKLEKSEDAANITVDALCKTVFGYHLLLVNSISSSTGVQYTSTQDDDYQKNLSILLYKDSDDEANNIVVSISAVNNSKDTANINQLFIYYVQSANDETSSLNEKIKTVMASLFDDVITTYTSSNFQTYLLLSNLKITIKDTEYKPEITVDDKGLDTTYYANLVTNYGENEEYISWVDGTYSWVRPEK